MIILGMCGVILLAIAVTLIIAEAAVQFLPYDERARIQNKRGKPSSLLSWVVAHHNDAGGALRLWLAWCISAVIIILSLLMYEIVDNLWLAGFISACVLAIAGFFLFGISFRRIGRMHSLAIITKLSGPIRFLTVILGPIPEWLQKGEAKMSPYSFKTGVPYLTDNDLHNFVERAHESRLFEQDETRMLHSVIEFGSIRVRAVLVPRTNLVTIDREETLDNAVKLFLSSGFSRIPVITEDADHIVGVLYVKDVMNAFYQQMVQRPRNMRKSAAHSNVTALMREAQFIPESQPINEVLELMKRESNHLAVVIDEYGGTAGIVTLEDIVEEIVGEIVDEYDREYDEIVRLDEHAYRAKSTVSIETIAELFDRKLSDEHVDTVGGLLSKILGKVPMTADTVCVDGLKFVVGQNIGQQNFYIFISEVSEADGQL